MSLKTITSNLTQAVIDLSACRHNLTVAKQASPDSKCIAIIKANAYGHGITNVAAALNEADAFGVARINEAIQLRQENIAKPIILLEGFISNDELELAREYNLDSVVHNDNQIQLLENSDNKSITVWLKIDTGMHRLGFNPEEVDNVLQRLQQCNNVNHPVKLMTHLANADDKSDGKTLNQIDVFYQTIEKQPANETSIANSAGILGWPQSHVSWNRPGIMLYGVSPFIDSTANKHDLKPVMTLSSKLIAVKNVNKGESIGYGGTYVCDKNTKVGVVAAGYGDGYPRHAKTGTPVLVNGKRCSLLGRVSMDMICVELGEQDAKVNDPVILWGAGLPVEEVADFSDTIAYELLCGVTSRVKFSYID